MSYLLDTNVVTEIFKPDPAKIVMEWFKNTPDNFLYVSVLTLGEIRKGVEKHPNSKRKEQIRIWLEHYLPNWFENRILDVDQNVADKWGYLQAAVGRPVSVIDSLIAATALHHDLRLITRNTKDFRFPGLQVINPWD